MRYAIAMIAPYAMRHAMSAICLLRHWYLFDAFSSSHDYIFAFSFAFAIDADERLFRADYFALMLMIFSVSLMLLPMLIDFSSMLFLLFAIFSLIYFISFADISLPCFRFLIISFEMIIFAFFAYAFDALFSDFFAYATLLITHYAFAWFLMLWLRLIIVISWYFHFFAILISPLFHYAIAAFIWFSSIFLSRQLRWYWLPCHVCCFHFAIFAADYYAISMLPYFISFLSSLICHWFSPFSRDTRYRFIFAMIFSLSLHDAPFIDIFISPLLIFSLFIFHFARYALALAYDDAEAIFDERKRRAPPRLRVAAQAQAMLRCCRWARRWRSLRRRYAIRDDAEIRWLRAAASFSGRWCAARCHATWYYVAPPLPPCRWCRGGTRAAEARRYACAARVDAPQHARRCAAFDDFRCAMPTTDWFLCLTFSFLHFPSSFPFISRQR